MPCPLGTIGGPGRKAKMTIGGRFMLRHEFKDVQNMIEGTQYYSNEEEHFNVPWEMYVVRNNGNLAAYLDCRQSVDDNKWTIKSEFECKLIAAKGENYSIKAEQFFESKYGDDNSWGWDEFIGWEEMEKNYMNNNNITIEMHVEVKEMIGISTKLLKFDESMSEFSDVILIVNDEKFYVLKKYLAFQSTHFKSLFMGNFEEATKREIPLKDIDSEDFQKFLEVLYGQPAIDDITVNGILHLAYMYDAQSVVQRCEEFILEKSKHELKKKLQMAARYNMDKLKEQCLDNIKTIADIRSVVEDDLTKMDQSVLAALLGKCLSFN